MNRLFSEFFRKFGGAFLEVCETISGGFREVFGGNFKDNYPKNLENNLTIAARYYALYTTVKNSFT